MGAVLTIHVIILGILEGLTEFLPVSSTAHLLLAGHALGITDTLFLKTFSIAIQTGAILAVVFFFWRTIWNSRTLWWKVGIAFIPTALAGILLYPLLAPLFQAHAIMASALILGGIALLFIRTNDESRDMRTLSVKEALLIGTLQIASFVPGISRAGATLIGGSLAHISRSIIVPFSFLLAIPTIIGAGVVEARQVEGVTREGWLLIVLGAVIAFMVAVVSIKYFITLLTKKPLAWLGWYRIVLGIIVLLFL